MDLKELRKHWDAFGRTDPLWAILTTPEGKGGQWDRERFFETGRTEIERFLSHADKLGLPAKHGSALDFGCGVGRLTQALCSRFERCVGVDIAASMLELARAYNKFGDRCEYRLNTVNDLRQFPGNQFDLIYSNIVLQHMQPVFGQNYIREFFRLLKPQGLVAFQLAERPRWLMPRPGATQGYGPLPDSAYNAIFRDYPSEMTTSAGSAFVVQMKVRNGGTDAWPCFGDKDNRYVVRIGNHWLKSGGGVVAWDDARANLPYDLLPGAEIEVMLTVTAPRNSGSYLLQLDVVQEHVTWFSHRSTRPATIIVHVEEPAFPLPSGAGDEFTPRMEVYGTPQVEVLKIIAGAGGRTVDTVENDSTGDQWTSFLYFATK